MSPQTPKEIRVRMAPSPTGKFHVGSARTTLFNHLFAKHTGGKFILRIEDTDTERSKSEFEADILSGLNWLGLTYDEGPTADGGDVGPYAPYRQSKRTDLYEKYLRKLLTENHAYYCFCSAEELEATRQALMASGQAPKYSGKCRSVSREEAEKRIAGGEPSVIRFKVTPEKVKFTDIIRGEIEFDNALIGDQVIAKNLRAPLYNFTVVVDDYEMRISHVIRGEDHIANTPKQIALQRALELPQPLYAHIPLILNPDRSKMSKRAGDTAVAEYREAGYLPEAVINFLALLGWHPTDDKEVFTPDELAQVFTLERTQKGGAVFNAEKLDWLNNHYLRATPTAKLVGLVRAGGFVDATWNADDAMLGSAVELVRERLTKLSDVSAAIRFIFELPAYEPRLLLWKTMTATTAIANLEASKEILEKTPDTAFTKADLEANLMPMATERGRGEVLWPLRVALSGSDKSPGPFEIMAVLGKGESLARISGALAKFGEISSTVKE